MQMMTNYSFFRRHGTYNEISRGLRELPRILKDDPNTKSYLPYSKLKNIIDQIPCKAQSSLS